MMVLTSILALVALVVGLCSAAPNYVNPNSESVFVSQNIDNNDRDNSSADSIVGGTATTINEYPWVVQMEFFSGVWYQACAANIISSSYVLSAAQCTHSYTDALFRPENRRIRAGATNTNTGGSIRLIISVLNHPSYNPSRDNDGDISLIRLNVPLYLGPTIQSIIIAHQNYSLPENVTVVHAGWGANSTDDPNSIVLRHVTVNSMNHDLCKQRYAYANPPRTVTSNMICTETLNVGDSDSCQGNTGGPLYHRKTLIGIISSSSYCAESIYPGVSTRVASYSNWIANNVW